MTDPTNDFSHPATKVADCMAVVSRSLGVNPPNCLAVAYRKGNKKHLGPWTRLESNFAKVVLS